jgi:5-methylcytosine-specific restriction endonuclease McrA
MQGVMLQTRNQYKRLRYDAGLCMDCGEKRDSHQQLCLQCRKKMAVYYKERASLRASQGLCRCGNTGDITEGVPICTPCWFKNIAFMTTGSKKNGEALQRLFVQQQGLCAYSDAPLIPGRNACIDHKIPRARGGTNDLNNLQWVTKPINRTKGTMTHAEFLALCITIVAKHT